MAQRDFKVTGLDLSKDMVKVARKKARKEKAKVKFLQGDMTFFEAKEKFDAATCFCNTINHLLHREELLMAFENTFQALKPGGIFIFDTNSPQAIKKIDCADIGFEDFGDLAYVWQDYTSKDYWWIDLTVFSKQKNGGYKKSVSKFITRAYPHKAVLGLLKQAGFKRVEAFDGPSSKKAGAKSRRIFYAAFK